MHEAGHLAAGSDKNKAWSRANQEYAKRSKLYKEEIVKGESTGQFGILKKPAMGSNSPTIEDVMRYGLVTHYFRGNAHLPIQWTDKRLSIAREFKELIEKAQNQYDSVLR